MNKLVKIIVEILLAVLAVVLVWLIYASIMKPVNFNKEKAAREEVAIQRLKDLRTIEVAFKSVTNHFTADRRHADRLPGRLSRRGQHRRRPQEEPQDHQ